MTTLHSRQSGDVRRTPKSVNTGTFNFTSQDAHSICTLMCTKREKSDATISKSPCRRTTVSYRFRTKHALLLNFVRFSRLAKISPMIARSPARWPRAGRATSGRTSGEMSRVVSAQLPGNGRTVAAAMPPDGRRDNSQDNLPCAGFERAMSAPEACETTRNLAVKQPRNISQEDSSETRRHVFNHPVQKL